jgi:hypothetical protein
MVSKTSLWQYLGRLNLIQLIQRHCWLCCTYLRLAPAAALQISGTCAAALPVRCQLRLSDEMRLKTLTVTVAARLPTFPLGNDQVFDS